MKKSSRWIIVFAVLATVFTIGAVSAFAATGSAQYPPIVNKLAEKFGLDPAKVNAVFDQDRQERQTEMQKNFEGKLDQAVKDGELTAKQKDAILAKLKELEQKRQTLKDQAQDMTPKKMRETMRTQQDELKKWADDQGIDLKWLMPMGMHRGGPFGGRGGCDFKGGGPGWPGPKGDQSPVTPDGNSDQV